MVLVELMLERPGQQFDGSIGEGLQISVLPGSLGGGFLRGTSGKRRGSERGSSGKKRSAGRSLHEGNHY